MHTYYTFLENYTAAVAALCSVVVLGLYLSGRLLRPVPVARVLLVAGVLMALEFYPFQLFTLPVNFVFPITLLILCLGYAIFRRAPWVRYVLFGTHAAMMVFGLTLLSTSANTWGDGSAVYGVFIVPQSVLIMLLVMVAVPAGRGYRFMGAGKLVIALLGIALMYFSTNGFSLGDYDGDSVVLRRREGVFCCALSLLEGSLLLWAYLRHRPETIVRD